MTAQASSPSPTLELSAAKKRLLEQRLQSALLNGSGPTAIAPAAREGHAPLSFAQQRLWFLHQLAPESPAYHISQALRLEGPLDRPALERSLQTILRRHEALRTTFRTVAGEPVQTTRDEAALTLTPVDLRGLPPAAREAEAQRLAAAEARRPFDLSQDPMMRAALLRLDEADHVLVLTMHHIASDAWSLGILFRELKVCYQAFARGGTPELPPLPIQYADFAVWQRQTLSGETLERQLTYWKEQLAGAPEVLALPTDRPRPAVQTFRGARCQATVPPVLTAQLKQLSRREGVSMFMTLAAAFNAWLHRYTRQTDILLGAPIAGRTQVETENLIGFFVNTLVLRNDLSGDPPFRELLKRVRKTTLEAYAHQDLPFEQLVMELRPKRSASHMPLIQVMFVFQNAPAPEFALEGLALVPSEVETDTAKFDLTLVMWEEGGGLTMQWEHNRDLFDGASVERMIQHFQALLTAAAAEPDRKLSALPLQSAAERERLLALGRDTRTEYPRERCVHQLFEEQAAQRPEAIAVVGQDRRLTYRELNARANRLAHRLRRCGVGPDQPVCLCLERSADLIVALLAVLKAGGAYVSLDPGHPPERLAFMLADTGAPVVLTQQQFRELLPGPSTPASRLSGNGEAKDPGHAPNPVVICLDTAEGQCADESDENPSAVNQPEHLAYLSFTSGSTGTPKGVCVPHRAVVRLVKETNYARFGPEEVFLQFAPIAFDASTLEVWGALLNGARLVVFPPGVPSPAELGAVIREQGVTTLWLTAGLFHQMVEEQLESLRGVRQLLVGGDVLSPPHVAKAVAALPDCQLINGYGPTENTTFTCCYPIPRDVPPDRSIPIGRPIANTEVYVLDDHREPVPVGVPGELYAGGDGLARGYWNRPELTAEKFVPHPFRAEAGARLYRTGDLVRYQPDGQLEFLGRIDTQVKLRGFRVELGEIETVLAGHPSVAACAAAVREDGPGGKQLVAYVVAARDTAPDEGELRRFLRGKLPPYMVPQAFVFLPALPLLPSGKVNRLALPAPGTARPETGDAFLAPRTLAEEALARVWTAVLKLDRVGIHDNFFELGGHSILAIQVMSRLREAFGLEVPLRHLFESPTVADLAEVLEDLLFAEIRSLSEDEAVQLAEGTHAFGELAGMVANAPCSRPLPLSPVKQSLLEKRLRGALAGHVRETSIPPRPRLEAVPLSFAQQRLWFLDQLEPDSPLYNIPAAVRLFGPLDVAALRGAITAIVQRHEALRTVFVSVEGEPRQEIRPAAPCELSPVDLRSVPAGHREHELRRHLAAEARRPFDLARDLMLRAALFQVGDAEHVLFLNMHHIASDGWSFSVFFHELNRLYDAAVADRPAALPDLPIQYADYAVWQRQWLEQEVMQEQLGYWRQRLAGAPERLELPTDHPRPPVQTFRGRRMAVRLPQRLTAALQGLGQREGATLFMTLLAAFKTLLHRYTRQDDVLVGSPIAGRNKTETERLIGFFINTLVLRDDLAGNPRFTELLRQVRQTTLEAYANQDLPFEKLVEELRPERHPGYAPFVQVMFVLQNAPAQPLHLTGLRAAGEEVETGTAKFDLTLSMADTAAGLTAEFEFNEDLFEPDTIARMLGHFQTLLEGIAAHPEQRIAELPLLGPAERHRLLVEWNRTQTDFPRDQSVPALFAAQAARTPDAVAVVHARERLTYRSLEHRANQLAHRLRRLGVQPETCVGVYLDRSPEMIITLLAILKAGGAYVPLDRGYPRERLAFMLEDAQAPVLVTERRLARHLPESRARLVLLDEDAEAIAGESEAAPEVALGGENLAYVIYTSGSTGQPKGACVPHRAITRLVRDTDYAPLAASDVMAQASNCSFDAATWEIWGPLLNGARLVIIDQDVLLSPREFAEAIRRHEVTALFLTTALFNQFAATAPDAFRGLRHLLFGGEAVDPRWVAEVLRAGPPQRLLHVYGPTETTTFSTWHLVRQAAGLATVPIGRPLANTTAFVLDAHRQPVPVGVPGELYIGGDGLARGYLRRPELTAERFVPHPFSDDPQARLYKTGDLVRYRPDGDIEFLGRLDHQVKIRGFRVELGEVESALARHPAVHQCVVMALADAAGAKRLAAYVVPARDPAPAPTDLREFLSRHLPDYMVPAAFVSLTELPLTPNGKVDRRALPAPEPPAAPTGDTAAGPRDAVERQLQEIWEAVLDVRPVGIHQKFFELGGHSLLAVRLVVRIEKAFGVKLSVSAVFQHPTIAQLGMILRGERNAAPGLALVEIQPLGSKPPIVFVHGVGGGMFWGYSNLARYLGTDQPVYALKSRGLDGLEEFDSIEAMAAQYVADLRAFQPHGPYYLGGYCFGGNVAYEMARQLRNQGERVALLALINSGPPNSSYTQFRFTPAGLLKFARNLWYWAGNTRHWTREQRREFLHWKARLCKRRLAKLLGRQRPEDATDIEQWVDLSMYPEDQRKVWEAHVRALMNYHPQTYAGHVTLFRSPGHHLLCSYDPLYGWGELARGGVTVRIIPGAHERIIDEPHVRVLAAELKECLAAAQASPPPPDEPPAPDNRSQPAPPSSNGAPADRPQELPLTYAQQLAWHADPASPVSPAHQLCEAWRLTGPLDPAVLEQGLNELVRRHETLRTTLAETGGEPVQVVASPTPAALARADLRGLPPPAREEALQRLLEEDAERALDPRRDPPLRARLVRYDDQEHVLVLTLHALFADRRSLELLGRELAELYATATPGQPAEWPLPAKTCPAPPAPPRSPFRTDAADVAVPAAPACDEDEAVPALNLPFDRPPAAETPPRARTQLFRLPRRLGHALRQLSQREGITLFLILLAATGTLMYRYSRQETLRLGTLLSMRSRGELRELVGLFNHLVLLRHNFGGQPSFLELVDRVRTAVAQAKADVATPRHSPADAARALQAWSATPFRVGFEFEEALPFPSSAAGVTFARWPRIEPFSRFDLNLAFLDTGQDLEVSVGYDPAVVEPAAIPRLMGHLETLLEGVAARPDQPVTELPLLTAAERDQILSGWNATARDFPLDRAYPELFEAQVEKRPAAIAVRHQQQQLTYAELNQRANRLARHLQTLGVDRDDRVAVAVDRSVDFAVAVLAVLKAGGAYLPLDLSHPPERLAFLLGDARPRVVLGKRALRARVPAVAAELVWLDDPEWSAAPASDDVAPPQPRATPDSVAYVMYTSGSTGVPKGVQITHRSMVNHNLAVADVFQLRETDRVLQFAALSFDLSVEELFPTWLRGGTVVFRTEETLASMNQFMDFIRREQISVLNLPTAFWHELVEAWKGRALPDGVRLVVIGGEEASAERFATWRREVRGAARLINSYGPTETTVTSTLFVADAAPADASLPIGRPIANTRAYVLDPHQQPVPVGFPGELHIGGAGVARGYLHRPDLTAQKFVPDPFMADPDARMYKTGDLVRFRPDGNLEFLGRVDDQVKIRGFRVEPGEIEARLSHHPGVRDCVVTVRPEAGGEKRLVAYYVARGTPPGDGELAAFLREQLPDFMVPSACVRLDALPLTPHGKIDRQALPAPEAARPELDQAFAAPRNPLEAQVAEIFREVLGLDRVGIHDNFFQLGGHSLHAMQVIARVQDRLEVDTPLAGLFDQPTVAALVAGLVTSRRSRSRRATRPKARAADATNLPLSFAQQRLWFLDQFEPHSFMYNLPQGLRLRGRLDVPALQRSLREIVRRHAALRTRFTSGDGQPRQVIVPAADVPFRFADLAAHAPERREEEMQRLLAAEGRRPFDLARDLLIRALLVRLGEAEHVLLVTQHHIASDAWSIAIFLEELAALYEAFSRGRPSPLPELALQYADFACWQRDWLQGEVLAEHLAYWKQQLAGAPALLEFPADHARPAFEAHRGAQLPLHLPAPLAAALKELGQAEGCTLFMVLLAAFQTLAARYTGREDILIGSPIANRNRPEIEGLIGFFVNTLVLRTDLSGDPTFRELLQRARAVTLGAYAHQDLPFEKLVEELHPDRHTSYHPLFQVMLVLQNVPQRRLGLSELQVEPFEVDIGKALLDLTVELNETPDGLTGFLEYATDLFERPRMARLAGHFQTLLAGAAADPDRRLSELPLLTEPERHQLLVAWNETTKEFPQDRCAHELIEAQVRRTPAAVALVAGDERLTYAELDARAERVAAQLRARGVGPEVLVGVCLDRSPDLVAALLGIWKAGGAYVPMDPAYPRERLEFMLADAQAPVLVTSRRLAAEFRAADTAVLALDDLPSAPETGSAAETEAHPVQSNHLAYVMYTSGSTGRPKGVAIEHRNVVNFAHWAKDVFAADDLAGVLAATSICFDLSVFELFVPLCWGGTVVLAENALQLPSLPARETVTLVNTVPSAIAELLRVNAIPPSVRVVNLAGEPLAPQLVDRLYQQPGIRRVFDLYGPTEDTVYSTFALRQAGAPATIGRPLMNKQVYVLGPRQQPMPVGVPGEVFIGGAGLARGYYRRPELTAEKFVANPFNARSKARLYRTGDLARYRPDGNLEFLGRIDHQVKLRGFRIELGEIEAVLRQQPNVREAVVVALGDPGGDQRLAAYVVPRQPPAPKADALEAWARRQLPDYMVPGLFVTLDAWPLTPSGKIDRQALPAPDLDLARPELETAFAPPESEVEKLLAEIWREVLNLERVGIHDNFFKLGGHSLMVTRILSRLQEALQVELPLRAVFEAPTIARLAAVVEETLIREIDGLSEEEARRLDGTQPAGAPAQE